MTPDTHARYAALKPELQAAVDAILAAEIAKGWIPKPADIEEAIAIVTARPPVD